MTDMRDTFLEKSNELEKALKSTKLSKKQKALVKTAMEFGYSVAFCERAADINASFYKAQEYKDKYSKMLRRIK